MNTETLLSERIVRSFNRLRQHPASPQLNSLLERLVGELFGDADDVAATFDPTSQS